MNYGDEEVLIIIKQEKIVLKVFRNILKIGFNKKIIKRKHGAKVYEKRIIFYKILMILSRCYVYEWVIKFLSTLYLNYQ